MAGTGLSDLERITLQLLATSGSSCPYYLSFTATVVRKHSSGTPVQGECVQLPLILGKNVMAFTDEEGKYFNTFLQSSGMAGHYSPDGSIRHSCRSKQKISLFLFALYTRMYIHQTDGIPNSVNIPNIKATNTSSSLSFSHCF
jgi:hypothetical protein